MQRAGPFSSVSDDPRALASHLLLEIERGAVPVWPSTERFANALALGLTTLSRTRPEEVRRAVMLAPESGPIAWDAIITTA